MSFVRLLPILALAGALPAADLYVRPGAGGDGSRDRPLGSLATALGAARAGDRLLLAGGTDSSGPFLVATAGISILGGHAPDFSSRDPVRWPTILRAPSVPVLGGNPAAPPSRVEVAGVSIVGTAGSTPTTVPLVRCAGPAWSFTDVVLAGHPGPGIEAAWEGPDNVLRGCWLVDLADTALDARRAQPDAVVEVTRCTFALIRRRAGSTGARAIAVGEDGEVRARADAFWLVDGVGLENLGLAEDGWLVDGAFWLCTGGFYRFLGEDDEVRVVDSTAGLAAMGDDPDGHFLLEAAGNAVEAPVLRTDPAAIGAFTSALQSGLSTGVEETLAELRQAHGLGPRAGPGPGDPQPAPPAAPVPFPLERVRGDLTYGGMLERGAPAPRQPR